MNNSDDCNDLSNAQYPGAPEICNGQDDSCDGQIDEGVLNTYYLDLDGDSFGNALQTVMAAPHSLAQFQTAATVTIPNPLSTPMRLNIATFVTMTAMDKKTKTRSMRHCFTSIQMGMVAAFPLKPCWPVRFSMWSLKHQPAILFMTTTATTPMPAERRICPNCALPRSTKTAMETRPLAPQMWWYRMPTAMATDKGTLFIRWRSAMCLLAMLAPATTATTPIRMC